MIKKIIFYVSIISLILLSFLTIEMLPFIYESNWQGILFLLLVLCTFVFELTFFITNKENIKESILNNISIIVATMYVSFIYYNIYTSNTILYTISMKYLKDNYFILSLVFMFIILSMFLNYIIDKGNKS